MLILNSFYEKIPCQRTICDASTIQANFWENVSLTPISIQIKKLQYTPYSTDSAKLLAPFFKSRAVRTGEENGANFDTFLEILC